MFHLKKIFPFLILSSSVSGIILTMIRAFLPEGAGWAGFFGMFVFFTIQSNLFVILFYGNHLLSSRMKTINRLGSPFSRGAMTLYISFTLIIFSSLLEPIYNPEGISLVISILLHYVTPVLVLIDWVFQERRKTYSYKFLSGWAIYPSIYAILGLLHGAITQSSYYPFFDVMEMGWLTIPAFLLLIFCFIVIGFLFVFLNKNLPDHKK